MQTVDCRKEFDKVRFSLASSEKRLKACLSDAEKLVGAQGAINEHKDRLREILFSIGVASAGLEEADQIVADALSAGNGGG